MASDISSVLAEIIHNLNALLSKAQLADQELNDETAPKDYKTVIKERMSSKLDLVAQAITGLSNTLK